jgi:hypothetical protein
MTKKILIAGVLMAASLVQAEVLSWRVDIADGSGGNSSYVTAQLFATTSSGGNYWETGSNQGDAVTKYNDAYGVLIVDSNVSGNASTYYYVKLFTSGATLFGYSGLMSWTDLTTSGALVAGTVPDFPATTPWNSGTSVVPEPTSMALLAMGVSALLMRRKRRT